METTISLQSKLDKKIHTIQQSNHWYKSVILTMLHAYKGIYFLNKKKNFDSDLEFIIKSKQQ